MLCDLGHLQSHKYELLIAVPIVTDRKNTLEGVLGVLQAGKQQLEMIKFRSSGDTNVTVGQPTWKINTAQHRKNDSSICFPLRVNQATLQALGLANETMSSSEANLPALSAAGDVKATSGACHICAVYTYH